MGSHPRTPHEKMVVGDCHWSMQLAPSSIAQPVVEVKRSLRGGRRLLGEHHERSGVFLAVCCVGVSIGSGKPNKPIEPNRSIRLEKGVRFGSVPQFVEIGKSNRTEISLSLRLNFSFVT